MSTVLVQWGVGPMRMGMELKDKTMLRCYRKVKCYQGCTPGIWYQIYNVLEKPYWTHVSGLTVNTWEFDLGGRGSFPKRQITYLLLNSNIVNYLIKTNGERDWRPNFVIFVVWSALIISEWVVVNWSRKSWLGPAEISSFVFLVLFKDGERRPNPRIHLFVSDFWVQDFLEWPQGWKDSP